MSVFTFSTERIRKVVSNQSFFVVRVIKQRNAATSFLTSNGIELIDSQGSQSYVNNICKFLSRKKAVDYIAQNVGKIEDKQKSAEGITAVRIGDQIFHIEVADISWQEIVSKRESLRRAKS